MTRKSLEHFNCSWAQSAEAIGDKWSMMIIRDAFYGVKTFSAFVENIGISKNILAQRLEHLQLHGILFKRPIGVGTSRSEYVLTDKGKALFPTIMALGQWGDEWIFGKHKEPLIVVDLKNRKPIEKMKVRSKDGRNLSVGDITFVAGKGASENTLKTAADIKAMLDSNSIDK